MISHFKIDPQDSCFLSKTLFKIQCTVSCNLHFILYSKPQGNPDFEEGYSAPPGPDKPAVSSQFTPRL